MIKVGYLSDFPYFVGFGGKEILVNLYKTYINKFSNDIKVELVDYHNKNAQYDIIHLFGYSNWFYDIVKTLKANKPNIKIVISPNFYYQEELKMKLAAYFSKLIFIPNFFSYKRFFFENADAIITNSNAEKLQLMNIFGISEEKIKIIYNFIESNFEIFEEERNIHIFPNIYDIHEGYLLSVGFLDERKNTLNLLLAFLRAFPKIGKKLLLIGDFRFRNNKVKEQVNNIILKNKDKILHIPYIDRKGDLLKSAYFNCIGHVLPSFLETPGLSNLEAAIFKKPILVGYCKPVEEYFRDYAIYCDPKNLSSIEEGLIRLVSFKPDEKLYNHVINNFTEKQVIDNLILFYKKLYSLKYA